MTHYIKINYDKTFKIKDYIRIVRVSPFFNFIWGNELACLFLAPKHFGAFFVILTMKGKIRQT